MHLKRNLTEYERYFRNSDQIVNLALGDPSKTFIIKPKNYEIYIIPSLTFTIAGNNLLKNFHRFGNDKGIFKLENWQVDSTGVKWDRYSMTSEFIGTSTDWIKGIFTGTKEYSKLTQPGKPFEMGNLITEMKTHEDPIDTVEIFPIGLPMIMNNDMIAWESESINISYKKPLYLTWQIVDSINRQYVDQNKYRIDVKFLNRIPLIDQTYSLTHWSGVGAEPPGLQQLPTPKPDESLGVPKINVMQSQFQSMESLDINASSFRIIVYFDIKDSNFPNPTHLDDLLKKPPIVFNFGLYNNFNDNLNYGDGYDPEMGIMKQGVFYSLKQLIEFVGFMNIETFPASYNGDDLILMDFPISTQLNGKNNDILKAIFDSGGEASGLSLFEIKINNGYVHYNRER